MIPNKNKTERTACMQTRLNFFFGKLETSLGKKKKMDKPTVCKYRYSIFRVSCFWLGPLLISTYKGYIQFLDIGIANEQERMKLRWFKITTSWKINQCTKLQDWNTIHTVCTSIMYMEGNCLDRIECIWHQITHFFFFSSTFSESASRHSFGFLFSTLFSFIALETEEKELIRKIITFWKTQQVFFLSLRQIRAKWTFGNHAWHSILVTTSGLAWLDGNNDGARSRKIGRTTAAATNFIVIFFLRSKKNIGGFNYSFFFFLLLLPRIHAESCCRNCRAIASIKTNCQSGLISSWAALLDTNCVKSINGWPVGVECTIFLYLRLIVIDSKQWRDWNR